MELKGIVEGLIVEPWDHRLLNDIEPFTDGITSMERIATEVRTLIRQPLADAGMTLVKIKLGETSEHWVEITE